MGIYALFYNFFINSKRKKDMYINNNSSYPFVVVKLTTLDSLLSVFFWIDDLGENNSFL